MVHVTKNIRVESGAGYPCNMGIITTSEGIVIIDTPMSPAVAARMSGEIKQQGDIRYVFNSEEHGDHCLNNCWFGGVLITTEVIRESLVKTTKERVTDLVGRRFPDALAVMGDYAVRLPEVTFTGSLTVYCGSHTFRLFPLPGHTRGGTGIHIPEERVVFTADCIFHRVKSWFQEADPEAWLQSLDRLEKLDVDYIVPGHGEMCRKDYIREQREIVQGWVDLAKTALKAGMTQEEALVQLPMPDPYPAQTTTTGGDADINKAAIARLYHLYGNK